MKIERFIGEDQQTVWEKELTNGQIFYSACLKTTTDEFDMNTQIANEVKHMNWIKAGSMELLNRTIDMVEKALKAGKMVPYRVFSEKPFYDGQEQDMNPDTEEKLGRYSDTRLGTPDKALELNRTFIKEEPTMAPPVTRQEPVMNDEENSTGN